MRKLSQFVVLAEELNFTRAAARLHMSQQALSASIARLERELDVTLLERSPQQVSLTIAGEALLRDGRPLLAASRAVWNRVREVGRDEHRVFRIGRSPAITGEEAAALTLPLDRRLPGLEVSVELHRSSAMREMLLAGDLDLALGRVFSPGAGLTARVIARQPLRVALSDQHPLSFRGSVRLRDLADDTLVVSSRNSDYRHYLLNTCNQAGLTPRKVIVNPLRGTPPITAVREAHQFAFVTVAAGRDVIPAVSVLDIDPSVDVPVTAMWVAGVASPIVAALTAAD